MHNTSDAFYYGAQYYRKPNPARATHRFHLERIKHELGFNIVRVWAMWNYVEPKPGEYDLEEVHEILSICDELVLTVLIQPSLESAPYWLERKHPEGRYVNARGMAQELSGNDNHPAGGHPGMCLDNAAVAEPAAKFLAKVTAELKAHRSVVGYDCWNEPHIEPNWNTDYSATQADLLFCYCPGSIARFRQWLRAKYRTVDGLNAAWARCFAEWEDVNPPRRHGNLADWLDWFRFWFDNLEAQQRWRYDVIRRADAERFIMSHSGGVPPLLARIEAGINNFSLAKPVDLWGTSMAPLYQNWTTAETGACCDLTRSAARGKPYWISEMQAGSAQYKGLEKTPWPEPRHIRTTNWLSVAYGAKAIVYWCYLSELTGNEAPGYGLVRLSGETTPRAQEAARTWTLLKRYESLIMQHAPKPDVAILYDPDSSVLLFAQEGHDRWISYSHTAYYRAVWDQDCCARWITPENLGHVPERVLIIPMHDLISEQSAAAIRDYVAQGGTVIAETRFGFFSTHGMQHPHVPPYGLSEVFGLEEEEAFRTWPDYQSPVNRPFNGLWAGDEYQSPRITVERPIRTAFRAYGFLTPLRLTTAKPIGKWDNRVFAAHNRFGKGQAFYFGTYLGLSMFYGETGAMDLVRSIIAEHTDPRIRGHNLRPRLIESEKEALLCVFNNDRRERYEERIEIPERFAKAVDVYSDAPLPVKDRRIQCRVEPEDVLVIHLTG